MTKREEHETAIAQLTRDIAACLPSGAPHTVVAEQIQTHRDALAKLDADERHAEVCSLLSAIAELLAALARDRGPLEKARKR